MILTKEVLVNIGRNVSYLESKGYKIPIDKFLESYNE